MVFDNVGKGSTQGVLTNVTVPGNTLYTDTAGNRFTINYRTIANGDALLNNDALLNDGL